MRSSLNATLTLALTVSSFVPFGPHVLPHALEIGHHHDHDGVAHDHDGDHHQHEFQTSPDGARIAAPGVRLPAPTFSSFVVVLPNLMGETPVAPAILARSLDPPRSLPSPQFAALCFGNRAPPTS